MSAKKTMEEIQLRLAELKLERAEQIRRDRIECQRSYEHDKRMQMLCGADAPFKLPIIRGGLVKKR
jgi:hypothetical protein